MRMRFQVRFALLVSAIFLLPASFAHADWASWRGPENNGVARDTGLPDKFSVDPKTPENLVWRAPYGTRSTPIVMGGRVYLNNQVGEGINEQERVLCLDAKTGKLEWEKRFNVFHTDIVSVRLGWTVLAGDPATGNVYWHGTQGYFICFSKDGKILWQKSLTEEYGRVSGYGGRVTSPVIDEDRVIIGLINSSWGDQKGGCRFVAFNKLTGDVVWWSTTPGAPKNTYYSVPAIATIKGERLLISGQGNGGIHALKSRTGEMVWSHYIGEEDINVSPVVDGTLVYCGHGNDNLGDNTQGCVICLDAGEIKDGKPKEVWRVDSIRMRYTSPLLHDGKLYVADDFAKLYALDAKSGKQLWKFSYGRNARGSPVWGDGKIYITDVNSKFHILQPGPKKCKELHEEFFAAKDGADVEVNGTPAIAHGKIFFGTSDEVYCIGTKEGKAGEPEHTHDDGPAGKAVGVRLYPADVVLHPGQKFTFKVVAYDAKGLATKETVAGEWTLPVPPLAPGAKQGPPALKGTLAEGTLVVDAKVPAQQGYVELDAGKLGKATARVRVAPVLPYTHDFEKTPEGAPIAGWVNCGGKFWVTKLKDGSKVLRNNNTNASPLVCRANGYIGMPDMSDYTIEADVMGTHNQGGKDLPDIGIVNARYTLLLRGNYQQVQIVSWDAIPRVAPTLAYKWAPEVWYRLKLTVKDENGKARLLGKVWEKAKEEPKEWTISFLDPTPNGPGSPAVYGYGQGIRPEAPGTDIYFDNVRVYPNKAKE